MRKILDQICNRPECNKAFKTTDSRKKYCNRSCAAIHNSKNRPPASVETREAISNSLKKYYAAHPEKIIRGIQMSQAVGRCTRGKYQQGNIDSLWSVSKRTRTKILSRLNISCSNCGWNDCPCDLHHIKGRKIKNPHHHSNLSYLCPNCHRKAHYGQIENLVTLEKQVSDLWKDLYYG